MPQIEDPRCASDETAWEGCTDDYVIFQRACPDCGHGLLHAPARFHDACGGTGYLTRQLPKAAQ
jgi:hypothetical protein